METSYLLKAVCSDIIKGRVKPVGSKSPDGKYVKMGDGKWRPVKKTGVKNSKGGVKNESLFPKMSQSVREQLERDENAPTFKQTRKFKKLLSSVNPKTAALITSESKKPFDKINAEKINNMIWADLGKPKIWHEVNIDKGSDYESRNSQIHSTVWDDEDRDQQTHDHFINATDKNGKRRSEAKLKEAFFNAIATVNAHYFK